MPDTKHVTDEMVEAALDAWFQGKDWRDFERKSFRKDMRAALTAAIALLPKGTDVKASADFRAGAEWAAWIAETSKLYWAGKVDVIPSGKDEESRKIFRAKSATAFQVEADIRTALAALPEGGDVKTQFLALADMMERVRVTPEGVKLLTDLFEAMVKPLGIVFAMVEEIGEAAETILDVANYLKSSLDEDLPVYESKWLDGLMEVHGTLLGIAEPLPAAPQTRDAGGET